MGTRTPGPKLKTPFGVDLSGLPEEFPARALGLVRLFGFEPYTWQREELEAIYTNRHECFPLAYVQIAKKNGKTALAVMVALIELCLFDDREIYAVSDSERNLSSVFWLQLMTAIRTSGNEECFAIYRTSIQNPFTHSFLEMRPGNFAASQGINPHLVLVDEVHLMSREVWNGYLMGGDARDDPLVLGITTPGYNYDCAAFDLYNDAKEGSDPDLHARIFEPADPECDRTDPIAWEQSNPAMHESPALLRALKRHSRRMRENDFRRFRLGQWTATEKAWMPYGAFRALGADNPIPDGSRIWLALDGSWSGDTTALVACSDKFRLQVLGHWKPPAMHPDEWRVPMADVEQKIRTICTLHDVEEVVCDPARWSRNIQALQDEGLPMVEYPQSPQRLIPATTVFYDAVMDARLDWVRDDLGKALEAHIAAAEVKETEQGALIRKPSFSPAMANIDCAVAAVMAHDRAARAREADADMSPVWIRR